MILLSLLASHWWLLGLSILTLSSSSKDNATGKSNDESTRTILQKYLKPFDLELHDFPETGRGIRTLINRSPGDILLKVPVGDTITVVEDGSQRDINSLSQEQQLAMTLLHMKGNKKNHPYVSTILPKEHYAIWNLPESIWDGLILPRCYRETFLATRQMVQEFASSNHGDDHDDKRDDMIWAFSMVRSRSVAVPELETPLSTAKSEDASEVPIALIPGLDLFNHQFDAGTLLQLNQPQDGREGESVHWTLTSSKSYSSGDQIFLSYGDDKDNWKLLLTYGFTLSENPNSLVFWTWQDLLEAAGQVRPSVFPPRVQQSLLQHPQLYETYTVLSERRATFSYDGKTQTPRESLMTGLQMMENLAVQLGQPQDELLANDIQNQLLKNRRNELKASIESVQKSVESTDEWQPFLLSLQLVLEDELQCIS